MKAQAYIFDTLLDYATACDIQSDIHRERVSGTRPDTILLMQHKPVVTLGRRGRDNFLTSSPAQLRRQGIDYHTSSRGGDITCHGPGQFVLYPIIRLQGAAASARGYLWMLEEVAIRTASDFGIAAYRRKGMNGAWTDAGKVAAIGFHIKRWVTMHGMSINVDAVPDGFGHIVACGLAGQRVACFRTVLGDECPATESVAERLLVNFGAVCGRSLEIMDPAVCNELVHQYI